LRHNDRFYFVRNMFMVAMALAIVGYVAMPTAPPRFLPELGFVDTIAYYTDVHHDSAFVALFFNPYAAVPSMHVAFSLMLAGPAILITRRWYLKVIWACYPLLVAFVVIVTGNHWWFDAAVGAVIASLAAVVARTVLSRLRPADWAWRPRGAEVVGH
jgi:membrane-associated phospholipid phosphatase